MLNFEVWKQYEGQTVRPVTVDKGIKVKLGGDYSFELKCNLGYSQLENKKIIEDIVNYLKGKGYFTSKLSIQEQANLYNSSTLEHFENLLQQTKQQLKDLNEVIVYAYSDDLLEFEGSIYDEVSAYNQIEVPITKEGIVYNQCESEECPYYVKQIKGLPKIKAEYTKGTWKITAPFPHGKFTVYEHDGEIPYIEGILFNLDDIEEKVND